MGRHCLQSKHKHTLINSKIKCAAQRPVHTELREMDSTMKPTRILAFEAIQYPCCSTFHAYNYHVFAELLLFGQFFRYKLTSVGIHRPAYAFIFRYPRITIFFISQMRPWNEMRFINIITNNNKMLQPMGISGLYHFTLHSYWAQQQYRALVSWSIECLCLNFCVVFSWHAPENYPKSTYLLRTIASKYIRLCKFPVRDNFENFFPLSNKLIIKIIWRINFQTRSSQRGRYAFWKFNRHHFMVHRPCISNWIPFRNYIACIKCTSPTASPISARLRIRSTFDTIHWIFIFAIDLHCTPRDDIIDWVWSEIMCSIKCVNTAVALTLEQWGWTRSLVTLMHEMGPLSQYGTKWR